MGVLRHSFVVAAGRRRGNRGIAVSSRDVRFVYGAAMPCTDYVFFFGLAGVAQDARSVQTGDGSLFCTTGAAVSYTAKPLRTVDLNSSEASDLYKRSLVGLVQEARSAQTGERPPFCALPGRRSWSSRGPPIDEKKKKKKKKKVLSLIPLL